MDSTARRRVASTGASPQPVMVALTCRVHIDLVHTSAALCRR